MSGDHVTVLVSVNRKHAGKQFRRVKDGTIKNRGYGSETHFRVESVAVDSIQALAHALERVSRDPFVFVVRGELLPGIDRKRTRRLLHADTKTGEPATFAASSRHWFLVDVDKIACPTAIDPKSDPESAVEYVIGLLPAELHDAWCVWRFSSSQSVFDAETLSLHLWFWSETPLDEAALKRWAIAANTAAGYKLIDPAPFSAVQAHYVAPPEFVAPLADPLRRRCGLRQGLDEAVSLIIPPPHPKRPAEPGTAGYAPGHGADAYLALIGGVSGFREPIVKAIASFVGSYGSTADCTELKKAIRQAIDRADPGGRSRDDLDRYKSDAHLDDIIAAIHGFQGDTPGRGFTPTPPPEFDDPPPHPGESPTHIVDPNLPTITVRAGLRHDAADEGLAALAAAGTAFYQRGERIVRAALIAAKTSDGSEILTPGIAPVGHAALGRALGKAARWEALNRKGERLRIDPPGLVVEQVADMAGERPFPLLAGVIGTPTMRANGSLLLDEGYDEQTGLVLLGAPAMPAIPAHPSQADAERALLALEGLLVEFPFKDGGKEKQSIDRAVALSELLTPVLRGAMPTAPMHLANAPQPGTGKSYLADLASCIATGERAAVVAFAAKPEETEKRLTGSALGGHPILALDNASGTIEGDLLCQITERPLLQLRPLGTSLMARVANTFTVLANGNNAEVSADMVRRTIECRLDANMEAPEAREFRQDPLAAIRRARGTYIAAALTIARAYLCAGKPGQLTPLASYEAWSNIVRSPLVWLGRADPVDSMASLRSIDPARITRAALFRAWADELGPGAYQTADLINRANDRGSRSGELVHPYLHAALLDIGRDRHGGLEPRRVGKWLSKNENNVADGLKLTCDHGDLARPRWVLEKMQQ